MDLRNMPCNNDWGLPDQFVNLQLAGQIKRVEECPGGWYIVLKDDKYDCYLPYNIDSETTTLIYNAGSDGYIYASGSHTDHDEGTSKNFDKMVCKPYLDENSVSSIIIFPKKGLNRSESTPEIMEDVFTITEQFGTSDNVTTIQFSNTTKQAITQTVYNINHHDGLGPQTIALIDPVHGAIGLRYSGGEKTGYITPEEINILAENGARIIGFEPTDALGYNSSDAIESYEHVSRESGGKIDVVVFNIGTYGEGSHGLSKSQTIGYGLFRCLAGDSNELSSLVIEAKRCVNGEWIPLTEEEINSYFTPEEIKGYAIKTLASTKIDNASSLEFAKLNDTKLLSYDDASIQALASRMGNTPSETIRSDFKLALDYMNSIRSSISNCNITSFANLNTGGANPVSAKIGELIAMYISASGKLYQNVNEMTQETMNMAIAWDDKDKADKDRILYQM